MGLIASSAHGFKHCRKRASGLTLCMKEACHIQDLLRELKFNGFEKISIGNGSTGALPVVSTNVLAHKNHIMNEI